MRNDTIFSIFIFLAQTTSAIAATDLPVHLIRLPQGFHIDVYAQEIPNARSMALSPNGTLFVGNRSGKNVYAVVDRDKDFKADKIYTIADGLWSPNGIAFKDGALYVAEINRVLRYDNIEEWLDNPPEPVVVNDSFPKETWHGWKFIRFGPDGKLYVPVGAPCNACEQDDARFASIMRINPDGTDPEIYAKGNRNSVVFDWHPATNELWFTDNGRDMLGDDIPPDELNHAPVKDMHFGFPYCQGGDISDPEFGSKAACESFTPP